jgi:hypothetical protein
MTSSAITPLSNEELTRRLLCLEDIEQIKRVKYRYFRAMDSGDFRTLEDLYMDDVEVDYIGGTYRWELKGKQELIAAQTASFNAEAVGCHNAHHPEIDILSPTTATGTWYMTDIFMDFKLGAVYYGSAIYRDNYTKVDGVWKISRTTYKRVYEQKETPDKMPAITFSMLAEKRDKPAAWEAWWAQFR